MMRHARTIFCLAALCSVAPIRADAVAPAEAAQARQILEATGVQGGLVVHLGCGDGKLTAALRASDAFLVHGLDRDAENVTAAREHLRSLGIYGPVSVDRLSRKRLPYVDNSVNLVVAEDLGGVAMDEISRALRPGGVAYVKTEDGWQKTTKPVPEATDVWGHYLHDPTNNAVAHDEVVGPPRHLQWVGSPRWTRNHDHMSSFTAMVSAGGRVFYIMDEGPRAEVQLPPDWRLVARDAYNGTVLWKRPLDSWQLHLWRAKSGPAQLPRRLVAAGDTVFVTLGLDAPLTALDAATGETLRTYDGTAGTEEILHSDGVLFLVVTEKPTLRPWSTQPSYTSFTELAGESETWSWDGSPREILALEAGSGKLLWKARSPVAPLTLTADAARVLFHDGEKVVCLDRTSGHKLWASEPVPRAAEIRSWFAPTLVVHDDVVLFAGGEKMVRHRGGEDTMTALSATTGETLWTAEHPQSGYDSPEDLMVIDGLVWTAPMTSRGNSGTFTGRDLHTGEVKRTFASDCGDHMPHHRCHRAKATDRFILASRTGIEYVDLTAEHWDRNDWVRGACLYGIMPANGLTYAPPQSCACYLVAKLNGLNALAPARESDSACADENDPGSRLEEGPAYAQRGDKPRGSSSPTTRHSPRTTDDWPTYRHDAARSGATAAAVPVELKQAWQTELGGKLTSPVVAEGKVFVASVNEHTVHALDAATGEPLWHFTAGGRVDSPPTVHEGRVLFGSADGHVYCLRAADGELVWRFRAAPEDQRLVAFEQLESVWPVHGSVLVTGGEVHCVAGRSMYLDGGLRYVRLDAATGELISETVMDDRNPETGEPLDAEVRWPNLPVALPDVLSADGKHTYMRSQAFDLEGQRTTVAPPRDFADQRGEGAHLFSPTGFLDDSWWHRTYWLYGKTCVGGAGGWYLASYRAPTGRIMVFDDQRVFAFERQPQYFPRTTAMEYHLYAAAKEPELTGSAGGLNRRGRPAPSRPVYDWSYQLPVLGRALVLAGGTLFVAGPPDLADEEATLTRIGDPQTAAELAEQAASMAGRRGGFLVAVSADDGEKRAAYRLASMPVFDGMAAAGGRLFLSMADGTVLCLAGEGKPLPAAEVELTDRPAPAPGGGSGVTFTSKHPDFDVLTKVNVAPCELGYRLRTPGGSVGLALKKLETPITGQATFKLKLKMLPNSGGPPPPGNGFLAFGDGADDEQLVKCGLRNRGRQAFIVQGPLLDGKQVSEPVDSKCDEVIDVVVTVDLASRKVRMTLLGKTIEAPLERKLEAVSHVGYAVHSVACEFSPVDKAP